MNFNDTMDFYDVFDKYPVEFSKATTFPEFCELVGTPIMLHVATYRWVPDVFATAKAGKRTYRALRFPNANKFSDLFEQVKFLPAPQNGKPSQIPCGFKWISGTELDYCTHVGGRRGWSQTCPDTRSHYGATFYGTYVKPKAEVHAMRMTLSEHPNSYEAIKRTDGILILAHDGHSIGSDYVALLPLSENIEDMYDEETKAFRAAERKAEAEAWPEAV